MLARRVKPVQNQSWVFGARPRKNISVYLLGHFKIYDNEIAEALQNLNSVLELRNDYFKVTLSNNPQVKHSQLAHFIVVITNYDMSFANHKQPCPEKRFVWIQHRQELQIFLPQVEHNFSVKCENSGVVGYTFCDWHQIFLEIHYAYNYKNY